MTADQADTVIMLLGITAGCCLTVAVSAFVWLLDRVAR